MKVVLLNWQTGEILEKGVLSSEHSNEHWIEVHKKLNQYLKDAGINKVWLLAP